MFLHLYAVQAVALPHNIKPLDQEEPYTTTLNCILQAGAFPEGHTLAVRVNKTPRDGRQEGDKTVFSWQLQTPMEEVRLSLCRNASEIAYWRGVWIDDAIFHLGGLPVRVFFNGSEQPGGEMGSSFGTVPSEAFPVNDRPGTPVREERPEESPQEEREGEKSVQQVEQDDEEDEDDDEDEEEDVEDDESHGHIPGVLQDALVVAEGKSAQDSPAGDSIYSSVQAETGPTLPIASDGQASLPTEHQPVISDEEAGPQIVPLGAKVAAFHASPALQEQTLQALKELVAAMPQKTVVVDLSERSSSRSKQEYSPLSQAYLRDAFGALYWDRSPFIKTTYHLAPTTGGNAMRRFHRVIVDGDHPSGIPYLEQYLRQGYSMVFMDSRATYEESARRAVVEALCSLIPNLECGSLS